MEKIKKFAEQYIHFTESEWEKVNENFEKKIFSQNQIILEHDSVCRYFYFLESGLIRFFNIVDGTDLTKTFTIAPYCFTSRTSFRKQTPSKEGIECLEETIVWRTSFSQYQNLAKIEKWNTFIRMITNEIQEFSEELFLETKTITAENRYLKLLDKYPAEIIDKIPLKHLSSFLGIAPQSLSRIRKKHFSDKN